MADDAKNDGATASSDVSNDARLTIRSSNASNDGTASSLIANVTTVDKPNGSAITNYSSNATNTCSNASWCTTWSISNESCSTHATYAFNDSDTTKINCTTTTTGIPTTSTTGSCANTSTNNSCSIPTTSSATSDCTTTKTITSNTSSNSNTASPSTTNCICCSTSSCTSSQSETSIWFWKWFYWLQK